MECFDLLKNSVSIDMPLNDIVSAFENMCRTHVEDDIILFETGIYDFTGEDLFYFSMVRQFPDGADGYFQICADVMYKPDKTNKKFRESVWSESIKENIFDYIRASKAFEVIKEYKPEKLNIYMDSTE